MATSSESTTVPEWPSYILEQFQCIPTNAADEFEFYGAYNTLLTYLFPAKERFQVCPLSEPLTNPGSATNFAFVVKHRLRPVFFLHVKPAAHIKRLTDRVEADLQMRRWFEALVDECTLPVLYGVSALGTRLCFYSCDRETGFLDPLAITRSPDRVTDTAPAARWDVDARETSGVAALREMLQRIRHMMAEVERLEEEEESVD